MKIAIHAFDGITMFHLSAPLLVFGEVRRQGLAPGWQTTIWSEDRRAVRTEEGAVIDDLAGSDATADADLLIFPSWHNDFRATDDELVEVIRAAHGRGARVAGLCLGAFPVADSGLLDGRSAVTHWTAASVLAGRRPAVEVNPDALYVDHGDVLTSAGTASAIDACLHVLRTQAGSDVASRVARHLVVAPHRDGGQAQYVDRPVPGPDGGTPLGPTVDWALANLDRPLSVDDLAEHAGMSRRNFTRRFIEVMGSTPARWVLARRLDEARRLLETTPWSIERVARTCGFGSAVTFRQNFVTAYATTPTSYRHRFTTPGEPTRFHRQPAIPAGPRTRGSLR